MDQHSPGHRCGRITTFLIRGFGPLDDTFHYGRDLIPPVREAVADRPAVTSVVA